MLASSAVWAQSSASAVSTHDLSLIHSLRVIPDATGPALEILSSRPLAPTIQSLEKPARLVIDLPNAAVSQTLRKSDFRSSEINRIRISQYQDSPAIVRVVIEVARPLAYSWDAAGDRLMIRLHSNREPGAARESEPSAAAAIPVNAEPTRLQNGIRHVVADGSSITAGSEPTVLRLGQRGEVTICPRSTIAVTDGAGGRMFSLGTGAFEADYPSQDATDVVMTPDFRVAVSGAGQAHFAIQVDAQGNTCIRTLPGNTASAIVSELMGDGMRQLRSDERGRFRGGKIDAFDEAAGDCGCPIAASPLLRAANSAAEGDSTNDDPKSLEADASRSGSFPESAPLPSSKPSDVHIEVEAPLVYRAGSLAAKQAGRVAPVPLQEVKALPLKYSAREEYLPMVVSPPPAPTQHRGLLGRMKGWLRSIFG